MNIYIIIHSFNEAYGLTKFYEVLEAYHAKEDAIAKIEDFKKRVRKGTSSFFRGMNVKEEPYAIPYIPGVTYEWYDESGAKMFSHFYVEEITLK